MRKILNRFLPTQCGNSETLVVRSVGVERTVCERCGHLSFSIAPTFSVVTPTHGEETELSQVSGL